MDISCEKHVVNISLNVENWQINNSIQSISHRKELNIKCNISEHSIRSMTKHLTDCSLITTHCHRPS